MTNVEKLIDILNGQGQIYKDLLDISKNKTGVIVEGKVKELESITKVEQTLIFKMGDFEDQLEMVIEDIKRELSIDDKQITMMSIVSRLDGEPKKKLEEKTKEIFETVKELDHTNKLNAKLISNSLDYIDFSINLYSNANSDSSGSYEQSGDVRGNKSSFFDIKT